MRLIDADEFEVVGTRVPEDMDPESYMAGMGFVLNKIDDAPTIEERKPGKWIPIDIPWYQCSECGAVREHKSFMENFCPNCGADMGGEQE